MQANISASAGDSDPGWTDLTERLNCVVLAADNSIHTLLLSSEAKTGLKIPSGQIASGGLNIAPGQTEDLNIDFNTCASIVQEGNGQNRLEPVLQ